MDRAVEALKICRGKMAHRGVTRARLVTTEACRAATNGLDFVRRVAREAELELEIVDQRTEASLAVSGCAALADPAAEGVIVFDIGGGSTEIIWMGGRSEARDPAARIREWASLPIGVVTVAERYGGVDVGRALFERMVEDCAQALAALRREGRRRARRPEFPPARHLRARSRRSPASISACRATTGASSTGCGCGRRISARSSTGWSRWTMHARAANACIGRERADLVLAGCAIFEAIRRAFPSDRVRIADRGLREGILLRMMHEDRAWWRRRPS